MVEKFNFRQSAFMARNDAGEMKTRENFWVRLRKSKREEKIHLKRQKNTFSLQAPPAELVSEVVLLKNIEANDVVFSDICKLLSVTNHLNLLLDYLNNIFTLQPHLATALSDLQLIETLISTLNHDYPTSTQSSACLLICNYIALTDSSSIFISNNLIPKLISLINPTCLPLIENILWCFANLAGDNQANIKTLEDENLIEILVKLNKDLRPLLSDNLLKSFGYFFENISKASSIIYDNSANLMINLSYDIIKDFNSLKISKYIKTLMNLTKQEKFIEVIIGMDLPDLVLNLVEIPKNTLVVFNFIRNIVSGTETHTIYILGKPIIKLFNTYIDSENPQITASILFSISNILTVPGLLNSSELDQLIIKSVSLLSHSSEQVQLEASFVLKLALSKVPPSLFLQLLNNNLIESIIKAYQYNNPDLILNLLFCTNDILTLSIKNLNQSRDFDHFKELLYNVSIQVNSNNEKISEIAEYILELLN